MSVSPGDGFPPVSIIINTDGRAKSLATALESLRYLNYPNFEVVVVAGPTRDGTHELCRGYGARIKFAECPQRNLSVSRNLGIAASAGDLLAFLDDDAVPEPEWLNDAIPAFADPEVGVVGGFVHDHTGKSFQWKFGVLDRFGAADTSWIRATPEFNFPGTARFPSVLGANSLFRRSALVEIGGFDEEYEYFLDESDVILRCIDAGWAVAQIDTGFVHHKFMPSHIRNQSRVLTSWYAVIKNKTYFALVNGADHHSAEDVGRVVGAAIDAFRNDVRWAIGEKLLDSSYLDRFEEEAARGYRDGVERGLAGKRRLMARWKLAGTPDFTLFPPHPPGAAQHCYIFLSSSYPPGSIGGIARYVNQLAEEIARIGHQVHVLTAGDHHDRVDFENGVWVHRICIAESPPPDGIAIPPHLWNYSNTMFAEAEAIAARRPVACVCAPIWDVEGIAFLVQRKFRLVTSLHTTLSSYLKSNADKSADAAFMRGFAAPVLALEQRLMLESDGILANSKAIVDEVEHAYGITLPIDRLTLVPHGIADWLAAPKELPPLLAPDGVRLCFIGRLESRKGADVFLSLVPGLLAQYLDLHIDLVGNDGIPGPDGVTFRAGFERKNPRLVGDPRLCFHGEVGDERLRGFYSDADIIVAPSRFESFGLVHLEAMMHGKPVIGCDIGGMPEVIDADVTGLLAVPGDPASLRRCIVTLIEDRDRRDRLGAQGRATYLDKFSARRMADAVVACL